MPYEARIWTVGTLRNLEALDELVKTHPTLQTRARRSLVYICPHEHIDALLTCAELANVQAEVLNERYKHKPQDATGWWKDQRQAVLNNFKGKGWFQTRDASKALKMRYPHGLLKSMRESGELEHKGHNASSRYRVPKDES